MSAGRYVCQKSNAGSFHSRQAEVSEGADFDLIGSRRRLSLLSFSFSHGETRQKE